MRKRFLVILLLIIISFVGINEINNIMMSDGNDIDLIDNTPDEDEDEIEEDIPEEPNTVEINILAVGDIMFHMPQVVSARIGQNQYDFNPIYKYVKSYIQDADIALANYETVAVPNRSYSGFPRFNSPVETIEALANTGFDILSTANNHTVDQGREGIISTIDAIVANGMDYIGTSKEPNSEPLILDIEGIEVGFLSYTFGLNGLGSLLTSDELSYMVNLIDEGKIQEDIQILKDREVDLIVSYIHWGSEYEREPSEYQQTLGRNMVDWGVNIVLGSHPHVVQRAEIIKKDGKDNLIVYSMGNFISNQRETTMGNSYTEDGVMVSINIEKDFDSNEVIISKVDYIPTWVYRYGIEGNYNYEILPTEKLINGELSIDADASVMQRIDKSYSDVMGVFK